MKQNEKLTDLQRKLELTSANITLVSKKVESIEENQSASASAHVASLAKRVERIEENGASASVISRASKKIPREISVAKP